MPDSVAITLTGFRKIGRPTVQAHTKERRTLDPEVDQDP
jgi:hypothetical protein